jgi:hypothetical protein
LSLLLLFVFLPGSLLWAVSKLTDFSDDDLGQTVHSTQLLIVRWGVSFDCRPRSWFALKVKPKTPIGISWAIGKERNTITRKAKNPKSKILWLLQHTMSNKLCF